MTYTYITLGSVLALNSISYNTFVWSFYYIFSMNKFIQIKKKKIWLSTKLINKTP